MLYIVATPIGNLKDLSFRALETLKEVDLILCEDTRITRKLLSHFQISKPTLSYHQHSKLTKLKYILEQIRQGRKLALVSDAGTPTISDPGAKLISFLNEQLPDLKIISIPGPSALTAALSISGFPADKFLFLGFPPVKKKRKKFFEQIINSKYPVVFYESSHRIVKSLKELEILFQVSGFKFQVVVCRELTKKFETIYRGNIREIIEQINKDQIKGEFVVVINHA
ncbi:MAG: 16S rRNA (cytidine(1402)-2'-O)-methyltransferase [Patescibacteria group bacterium]